MEMPVFHLPSRLRIEFKLYIFALIAWFFSVAPFHAQKRGNIWYFGSAGVNFNTCPPQALIGQWGSMFEGSSAICDTNGTLQFYTDGMTVINANHVAMQNGTNAGPNISQTQNIIIPKPGSSTIYYVFFPQVQAHLGKGIVTYCAVDMSLNSGLGAVTTSATVLRDTVGRRGTEKLTAVRHANGTDIWLVGHDFSSNRFFAYLITGAGISTVAVESSIGPVIADSTQLYLSSIGELKASPDGTMLGFTCFETGLTALFKFDSSTGVVANPIILDANDGGVSVSGYGASFSSDNSKFYVSARIKATSSGPSLERIYQFAVTSWNQATIQASRYSVSTGGPSPYYSLKLGPDRKIYVSKSNESYLGVIHAPNVSGASCNYVEQGLSLNGYFTNWGLNNLMEMFDYPVGTLSITSTASVICPGSSVTLQGSGANSYTWQPVGNFPVHYTPGVSVSPSVSTIFTLMGTDASNCTLQTKFTVSVHASPVVTGNFTICSGNVAVLAASGANSYTWSNGSSAGSVSVNPSTTSAYTVTGGFTQGNCQIAKVVTVNVLPCVNVDERHIIPEISFYPNPAARSIFITLDTRSELKIYNMAGELLMSRMCDAGLVQWDLGELPKGVYCIMVDGCKVKNLKLILTSD
jgi:hypothetical protein